MRRRLLRPAWPRPLPWPGGEAARLRRRAGGRGHRRGCWPSCTESCSPLQTISPILSSEGTDTQCINQKAHLISEQNQLSPDWVAGLEGGTVICEDVTIRLSTSLPVLEGCLNVTCFQCENGKPISPIDSAQPPTMAHDADTDSDLARPPDGKHPSAPRRHATPAMLLRSATRRHTAGHLVAHPGPSDSE